MELELGLKVTRTREDVSSSVDFRFSKDPFGPLVLSRETDSMFIIIIHLKGFKKEGVEIDINKEGDRITIRGRKPVEEMVMIRWMAWRKEVEMRAFRKFFLIPDVVDLDKIKARFDDDDATLTITMPKRVKGISGFNLEQEEEEEEEGVDFGDVGEVENREEVEDENEEREESDEHSEIQGEEGFGEMVEDEERESQVYEGEEEGFSGGVDETQVEEDDLEEIQKIGQQELADSDTESEDNVLKNVPDIMEQEDNQEVMEKRVLEEIKNEEVGSGATEEIEEQESDEDSGFKKLPDIIEQEDDREVMEQKDSEETKSDDTGSGAVEETKEQESDGDSGLKELPGLFEQEDNQEIMEQKVSEETKSDDTESDEIGRTSKSRETEKKTAEGDNDGLRKAQGIEKPERHNEKSKIQEMVEEETGGQERINNKDSKREFDGKETQIEDDNLEKNQQIDEEETGGQHEFADSNTESEDTSSLRKLPAILEQENNQDVMEQKDSQAETRSDDFESRYSEATENQEPHEKLHGTSKGRSKADDDDLSKVQETEERERRNEVRKIQDVVEGDPKEDVDAEMGEGFTPNTERTPVSAEDDIAESETKAEEYESEKIEADKVDRKHELVENKEAEDEDTKENEEQHSKGRKLQDKKENIKDLVEEKDPEAETNIKNDVQKPVQEAEASEVDTVVKTDDEGKEKKKSVKMETAPNIAETMTDSEDFESRKLGGDEVDKIHKPVEKKEEEYDNVKAKGEDRSLIKLQENEEKHSKGRKGQDKKENIKELVEEKTPEAEKNIVNDVQKPVQENEVPEVGTLGEVMEQKVSEETTSDNIGSGALEEIEEEESHEDSGLEKLPDIIEKVMEQRVSEFGDTGSGEETREQESEEVGGTSKTRAMEKQATAGLRKAHGTEEPERHNEERKTTGGQEKNANEESNGKETQTEDENLEKSQHIDQQGKTLESAEEKNVGQQEFSDSVTETEDSSILRKPPDILEQESNQDVMDQKDSQEETRSDDFGSGAFEEIEKQDPHEQLDETSKGREKADDDDGLSKAQGIEEPERRNEVRKIQEMVEGETSDHEKRDIVKMETKSNDPKADADSAMGEGFTPSIESARVVAEGNVAETEIKAEELESIKPDADKVDKKHELIEKEEEEDTKVRRKSEDKRSLKLQENEKQHSKGRKKQEKQEPIKELVEEKASEVETNIVNDVPKPVQETEVPELGTLGETGDEGKIGKEKKSVENIAETGTNPEDLESDKLEADEVDKIHKLVEKKEEKDEKNAEVGTRSENISSVKPQEVGEQQSQGQRRHEKHKTFKELMEEKTPEAETTLENDTPKPVQEKTNDAESIKPQETIKQQELDEWERCKKESKTQELLNSNEEKEEKEIKETVTEEHDSYRPKVLGEEEKVKELAEEKQHFSKNGKVKEGEEITEKKTELGDDDDISRKSGHSDAKEEIDVEMRKGFAPNIAETVTQTEDFESEKVGEDEVEKIHKPVEKKKKEDANVRAKSEERSSIKLQENEEPHSKGRKGQDKQKSIKEVLEEKTPETETNVASDVPKPVNEIESVMGALGEIDDTEKEAKEKKKSVSLEVRSRDVKEEVYGKMGVPDIAETEKKPEEFESNHIKTDEVDKMHELVDKKKEDEEEEEEDAKVRTQSEDISLIKPQEIGEQQSQGQKQHHKQEKVEELVGEKNQEEERNRSNNTLKPVQKRGEGKQKIPKLFQEETNKQPQEYKEKMVETESKIDDAGSRKVQEVIRQKDLDEAERCERERRTEEVVKRKTNDEEKEEKEIPETKEQESYRVPNTAEIETKPEEFESDKLEPDEIHGLVETKEEEEEDNAKMRRQSEDSNLSKKLQETKEQQQDKIKELMEEKTPAAETTQIPKPTQEIEESEAGMLETCEEEKIAETDTETMEQELYRPKVFGDDDHHISRKVGDTGQRDSDPKEEDDPEMGKGSAPNITETEKKSDTVKAVEEDRIHELVEKKKKEEKDKVRRKSEVDSGLKRLQEENFQAPNLHSKQEKINELVEEKPVEETERPEVSTLETFEDKVSAETETKDQESYRPKILEGDDTIQELAEEKMNISRKVEEEETAANKKELAGDDYMTGKAGDTDAQEKEKENEKIQELVLEEKVSDGSKKIVAEAIIAENDKPRKAQEIDEQKSHEEGEPVNQVQELIEGETSGHGEVKGVESEKKTTEVDKRFREAQETERTDSDVSGNFGKGELQEAEKEDEDDRLERGTGKIEQELDLNSQMEQEPGEKTQELVDEKINNGKEEESETKTDDVIRKVHGMKDQELLEPERKHGSKIKEVVEKKTAEAEKEDECGGLRQVHGSEKQELHEPSVQERGEEIKDQRPDKESNEKQHKTKELVEAGHNVQKEEQKDEKLIVKAKHETEEGTSKAVQEIETHESDGLKKSVVKDKKKETEEKEKRREMEEKDVVDSRTVTEDVSLRKDQEDGEPEMSKPYKRQEEDKIQEQVEVGASDYKEKVSNQDGIDISRSQEPGKPTLDELERQCEQTNIPQGEDKIQEPEMKTHDCREKVKKKDAHDVPQSVEEEKVENMGELEGKVEDDSSDTFNEFEERKPYEDWTHETWEKSKEEATDPKESEEKDKSKAVEEKEIVDRRTITRDDAGPELSKPYKTQEEDKVHESVETGTSDCREEVKKQDVDDTLRSKEESTGPGDKRTSEKVAEIEKQKSDELQRFLVQDKMQETEENEETTVMKENEVQDGKEAESSKPYKRLDEDKIKELVERKTSDYREKVKTQDGDDIQERDEEISQTKTRVEDETKKEVEKNQKEEDFVDDPMTKTQESEKEESEIQEKLDIVQDFVEEETRDQEDEVAMEDPALEANYDDDSSRTLQTIEEPGERKEQKNDHGVEETKEKEAYDDWTQEERGMMKGLVKEEALDLKHTGGKGHNDHKEEQHEEKFIPKAVKAEEDSSEQEFDELQRSLGQDKIQETEEKGKPRSMEENETVEGRTKTEDGSLRKVQEGEDPELSRNKRHEEELKKEDEDDILRSQETGELDLGEETEKEEPEELDIAQDFVEDKTWDQEDERVKEAEAVVANNEEDISRKLHTTGGEELKEHEEHDEIPATSDHNVKEEDGERVAEKETNMAKFHVQEPEVKTDNEESRRGQKGKQEKNVETRSGNGIVRKVGETKVQEPDEKKDQEPGGKIEEPERKEASNDGVKLVAEEDNLIKGQEFIEKESSKRRPVGQENIQQLMDAEEQEDEGKSDAGVEMQAKIKEEKGTQGSEKVAEVEMQAKIGIRMKDQETKRQELYELNEERDKVPEPVVKGTYHQKEKEKRVEDREVEEMKRKSEDVSSREVQKIKSEDSDGLEKDRELSGFQESQTVKEEEVNEAGGYKPVLTTKSMEDSIQSQDVEEKGLDQTERYAEQEDLMAEEEEKEQNEKAKRMPQVDSKAKDDISKKNETERLRGQKLNKDHQEVVEMETSDQKKEKKEEKIVGKAVTRDECDSSRKNQEHEGEQSDKLGRHREEEVSGLLAKEETSNDKEDNRGNRAGAKTTIKDVKKQLVLEKDTSGKSKENMNQESKSRDDISRENEKQESHEQQRSYEEHDKKKLGPKDYRNEEDGKEDKDISEAEGTRKSKGIEQREATKMVGRHDYQDNISDLVEEQSDKPERRGEEEIRRSLAGEETSNDKEENRGNRAGAETTIKDDGFREEQLVIFLRHSEQDKKQLVEEKDTSGKAKDKRNQETKSRDDSSRKTLENEKQDSYEQKRNYEEQDKKNMGPNYFRNEEDGKEDKETAEAEVTRKKEGIGQREATKVVEEKRNNQEEEDKKRMSTEVLKKSEDHESKEPERLRKQDNGSELVQQRAIDNPKGEETTKTETEVKDTESRKTHQLIKNETGEEEVLKEKENRETECEGGSSKMIKELEKEESSEPRSDEERDKIQLVDRETSEDDEEEELEVEVEDSEEDWEAEVIQEMDSDEDHDKLRKIRRIKLGFRLVGGSTLFMSLIVIVISIIRSKRKTRCYKF